MKCFEIEAKIIFGLVVLRLTVNMKCFEMDIITQLTAKINY